MNPMIDLKVKFEGWLEIYQIVLNAVNERIGDPEFDQSIVRKDEAYWKGRIRTMELILNELKDYE